MTPLTEALNQHKRLRRAGRVVRWLFGDSVVVVDRGDLQICDGYVTLWNDIQPVVSAARQVRDTHRTDGPLPFGALQGPARDLSAALDHYEHLYPEHAR